MPNSEIAGFVNGLNGALASYLGKRTDQNLQEQQETKQKAQQGEVYNQQVEMLRGTYKPIVKRLLPDISDEEFQNMTRDPGTFQNALKMIVDHHDKLQGQQDKLDEKSTKQAEADDKRQQDLYEKGSARLTGVRGDTALKGAETMRDATIQALATVNRAEDKNPEGIMNPTEYVDTISQLYKAKNGSSPDVNSLEEMKQKTLKGKWGYGYTLLTGNPAPATSKEVQQALKDFIVDTGTQADRLHEGYMNPRNFLNPGISGKYKQQLEDEIKQGRGTTFKDYRSKYFKDFDSEEEALASKPKPGDIIQVNGRRFRAQ